MSSASVSMDVNLTISLMRGQMGAVIEKAVNVAVETVLGEMIRVVGLKFEEIKREIGAKEKENENIRRMLETSQCQMKTMRKYISVLTAKESNQRALQGAGDCMAASVGLQLRRVQTTSTALASVPSTAAKHRSSQGSPVAAGPSWARQQMTHVTLPKDAPTARSENHIVDLHLDEGHNVRVSAHKGDNSSLHLVDSQGLLSETSDPIWGQSTLTSTEPGHSEMSDSSILSETLITDESTGSKCTETFGAAFQKIKLEDGEVEIVSVKDEPTETSRSSSGIEFSNVELQQVRETEFGGPLDLPTAFQTESPGTSSDLAIPSFIGMEPISYEDSQLSETGAQRQARTRRKDLNLYEEYKRSRTLSLRGRSTNHRRELDQALPQALLADLVRERREKTRLRVARWRAKRKLQACLMASQAAQFNGAPGQSLAAPRGGLASGHRRGGPVSSRGGFGFRRGMAETGTYNLLLQLGPSSAQSAAPLSISEGVAHSGSPVLSQHRTSDGRPNYQ